MLTILAKRSVKDVWQGKILNATLTISSHVGLSITK